MPNPKRRHSKRRTSIRRAHDALKTHSLSECPNCHERKMPHRACPKCGHLIPGRWTNPQGKTETKASHGGKEATEKYGHLNL